ncbi:glycosyltransferase [Solirubrobacter ginsenosidimutans]|uniref:Glycosyltransferase n=1 Tax=Solirubrobacter ginsenosidimutans TaxID=490573 RepID=A0A9X3S8E0_9ACTN|nr:glycosyltransferase [Solirubrobacter ginsenosidimutans]MDA0166906.1 glycosyltransferase [Solirubrobacter ginsenosidimutans]
MRVLIASTGGHGHFGPLLPFADALADRGDDVLLAVPPELEATVAAGRHAYRLGAAAPREIWARVSELSLQEQSILGNREWFGRLCVEAMLPTVEALCDDFAPDLVLHEAAEYASAIAAHRRGIEHIQVAVSQAEVEWGSLDIAAPVLPADVVAALRASPYASHFPASLDPSPYPHTHRYNDAPAVASSRELVYVTFGTTAAGLGYEPYRAALDAVAGLDVEVLMTTGADLDLGDVPANVRVERWVPQPEALARASLVVCHGGSGTVLGALAAAIPLIVMPMFDDQFANARALEAVGAAVVAEPATLRAAILAPPPPAHDLARELRAAPPPLTALRRAR